MGNIEKRRSIRKYRSDSVEIEKIEAVLVAALQAPSPKNRQPWRFIVITDQNEKKRLVSSMKAHIRKIAEEKKNRKDISASFETLDIIEEAPVFILVCYKYGTAEYHDDDIRWKMTAKDLEVVELQAIGAAVENMLLKAEELGLGSLWCADILYAYDIVAQYSSDIVISGVCLGYKDEMPSARKRNSILEMCRFI